MDDLNVSTDSLPSRAPSKTRELSNHDYIQGIGLLLIVVILWTASNFVTQNLFQNGYEKPFLVTYMNTASFSLYLLPVLSRYINRRLRAKEEETRGAYRPIDFGDPSNLAPPRRLRARQVPVLTLPDEDAPLTTVETAKLALIFCFLWFLANWTVTASLEFTSVASCTVLASTSGFFTLGIGRLLRVERMTIVKLGAVLTSFSGVVLVSLSDSSSSDEDSGPVRLPVSPWDGYSPSPIFGDTLALLSAMFYALYVILLKVRIHTESRIDMQVFFGFVGLFNVLACWPIGVILHLAGWETLELPETRNAWAAICINMAITFSSDYIYVLAMLKTTPLVSTVALSLTIPFAVLGDFLLKKPTERQALLGALLVLFSFAAIGIENPRDQAIEVMSEAPSEVSSQRGSLDDSGERSNPDRLLR